MKILSIAGARPNFMKLAAIADSIEKHNAAHQDPVSLPDKISHIIVHTGQHYDRKMSHQFFDELGIPAPDINLGVGSATHAVQTAEIMKNFEPVLLAEEPDFLLVVGDVNSTIACTLVASKIQYSNGHYLKRPIIVHVEAGLRSFDRDMPEEINRILTDSLSDLLFVTEKSGIENLEKEGVGSEKIKFVGNVMIDTLKHHIDKARSSPILKELGIQSKYGIVTLHRPSNVDLQSTLQPLINCLHQISEKLPLIFSVHPRTRKNIEHFNLWKQLENNSNMTLTGPLGYLDFLNLVSNSSVVITDSGGIQEETTFLKIPCVTLRENTERPVTVTKGSNYLIGTEPTKILSTVDSILAGKGKRAQIPELWDGRTGERIIEVLVQHMAIQKVASKA